MEKDKEIDVGTDDTSPANLIPDYTKEPKNKGINLLKRSKHDLLRLLSILEGELEAREIFIAALQAQLSNQQNARRQYFVHRMTDPFFSLHRDDYAVGNCGNKEHRKELERIEPLPLLEKVVRQFKNQQQKMHQQMALASKIHRKMAHELAEEKRKHAVDTKTGDDVTMALEKERERLRAGVMCEKERTKRIETEYRKLLVLCKEDGRKHKMIVMALLSEQERLLQQLKESKELKIDVDSTETELQARLHEALKEKQELAMKLKKEQLKCSTLKSQVAAVEDHLAVLNTKKLHQNSTKPKTALEQASALYECDVDDDNEAFTPELPVKMSRVISSTSSEDSSDSETDSTSPFLAKHHPMSVARSTQDVTLIPTSSHPPILLADGVEGVTTSGYYSVKPGSSIAGLEAMKSAAHNKEMLSLDLTNDKEVFEPMTENQKSDPLQKEKKSEPPSPNLKPQPPSINVPPKPNRFVPGSPNYVPFRNSHSTLYNEKPYLPMTSSPTSGAANFAMNSPNAPTPPLSSPFSITRTPTVKASSKFTPSKFETPTKLSAYVTKAGSPGRTPFKHQSTQFQSTRMKFQAAEMLQKNGATVTCEVEVSKTKENIFTEKKIQKKKFTSVNYKSHISQKVSTTALPNVIKPEIPLSEADKIKQPLPPKTRPISAPQTVTSQVRPPPLPPKKPSISSEKSVKRTSVTPNGKNPELSMLRKSSSVKRATPLTSSLKANSANGGSNHNNSSNTTNPNNKGAKGPTPPTLPAKMSSQQPTPPVAPKTPLSAQQRLFPSSESDGPPLSPITHSVPKAPNTFFGS